MRAFSTATLRVPQPEHANGAACEVFEAFRSNSGSSFGPARGSGGSPSSTAAARNLKAARYLALVPPAALRRDSVAHWPVRMAFKFAAFDGGLRLLPRNASAPITLWIGPAAVAAIGRTSVGGKLLQVG